MGFYDRSGKDKARRISVKVKVDGLRAVHSYNYRFDSDKQSRRARLWSGYLAPEMFAGTEVRGRLPRRLITSW